MTLPPSIPGASILTGANGLLSAEAGVRPNTDELTGKLTDIARMLKKKPGVLEALAADPEQRQALEKILAEFRAYHPILVTAAREIGQCQVLLTKALRCSRNGFRA